ncbi:alpha-beta hydrolase superfamily lysophospholipase [Mesorhizobium soli]|uniref:alpha/beta hydrolase n=1 Tax=Pseudaminobacter soli (ex Li et al. 2025) TaxID=1295366 RepID=UPI002473A631|nr:alpha/beta hydrolase [Mesorhizobium soli]MDH6232434.1 alpha-beta hydrolase superfamily lysophospholipase [Mesorhizobium soli]
MPFDRQMHLQSPSGARINLYTRRAEGQPLGVVQVNHGLAEHAARYARFADTMAADGFHVYVHDHRGHGDTAAPHTVRGMFATEDGVESVMADVGAVHTLIGAEHPNLPVIVFGHSMGGIVALNYVLRHPQGVGAAAIWNANFSAGLLGRLGQTLLAYERFRMGSDVPSRILPRLTFQDWAKKVPDRRTDFDWLSRDEAEVAKYVADPLCGWDATVSMWQDVFEMIFFAADDRNFSKLSRELPFHLVGGEKDPATSGGKAVDDLAARLGRMGFSNLFAKVYAETRHESLNEVNRHIIAAQFAEWAKSVVTK